MADLKKIFESLKFREVSTILASGNVLFTAPKSKSEDLSAKIQSTLTKAYKKEIGVIVRTIAGIHALIELAPFKKFTETFTTKLYVTFLSGKPTTEIKAPWDSPIGDVKITQITNAIICWVAYLTPTRNSADCMSTIEKEFGKKVTTRNWNTILKIAMASDKA
jgi:uncharacterized protein (DUF1697 family)